MPISDKFKVRMDVRRIATSTSQEQVSSRPKGSLKDVRKLVNGLAQARVARDDTATSEYAAKLASKVQASVSDEPAEVSLEMTAAGEYLCPRDSKPMTRVVLPNNANAQFCQACRTTIPVDAMY